MYNVNRLQLVYFDGSPRTWNDIFYIETLHGVDLLGDGYNRSKIKQKKTRENCADCLRINNNYILQNQPPISCECRIAT